MVIIFHIGKKNEETKFPFNYQQSLKKVSKFLIGVQNKAIFVKKYKKFNENMVNELDFLEHLKLKHNFNQIILVVPKTLRFNKKITETLIKLINKRIFLIISSPIHRAILKTEAVFKGADINYIVESEIEILNKLKISAMVSFF